MPGVMVPQKQGDSGMGQLGTLVGGAAGAYFGDGNPAAIGAGAAVGGAAGNALGSAGQQQGNIAVQNQPTGEDAISRRMDSIQNDPSVQLAQANAALKQMPPEYQQQYGPTIDAARQRDFMGGVA